MRLDPKHFNVFLGICAVITAVVIFFGTVLYVSNQQKTFKQEIDKTDLNEWKMIQYANGDTLSMNQFEGEPVVILFWSTWSEMSMSVNESLHNLKQEENHFVVIAAATRDGDELVKEYIDSVPYDFIFVNGTSLYHDLMVPGLPSQLFLNRKGEIVDHLVGNDSEKRKQKIQSLLRQN